MSLRKALRAEDLPTLASPLSTAHGIWETRSDADGADYRPIFCG
jgi:hypothetical protein